MNILVIGLGSMGKRRIRLLRNLCPTYRIIGVDSNSERADYVQREYGITCYKDIDEAKSQEEIESAFVCTSPLSHSAIITKCLSNEWNVFTEINLVADGYDENIKLAKDKNKLLFLSSTPMYKVEMQKVKEEVKKGNKPVSYLYHVGQYLPDWHPWETIHNFFVGDKRTNGCREIFAIELPWITEAFGAVIKVEVFSNQLSELPVDYHDNYLVRLHHQNGSTGTFHVDVVCRHPVRHLEVYNEDLYMEWNGTPESFYYQDIKENAMKRLDDSAIYQHEEGYGAFVNEYAYVCEIKEFLDTVESGKAPRYGFEKDKETLKLIDWIENEGRQ